MSLGYQSRRHAFDSRQRQGIYQPVKPRCKDDTENFRVQYTHLISILLHCLGRNKQSLITKQTFYTSSVQGIFFLQNLLNYISVKVFNNNIFQTHKSCYQCFPTVMKYSVDSACVHSVSFYQKESQYALLTLKISFYYNNTHTN